MRTVKVEPSESWTSCVKVYGRRGRGTNVACRTWAQAQATHDGNRVRAGARAGDDGNDAAEKEGIGRRRRAVGSFPIFLFYLLGLQARVDGW